MNTIYFAYNIMGCKTVSKTQSMASNGWNPIIQYLQSQKKQIPAPSSAEHQKTISYEKFKKIFPQFQSFSEKTVKNIFELTKFSESQPVTSYHLESIAQIIRQSENTDLICNIIFYGYSEDMKEDKNDDPCRMMGPTDYQRFIKENQGRRVDQSKIQIRRTQNKADTNDHIGVQQFRMIFENYKADEFIFLFRTAKQIDKQQQLLSFLKKKAIYVMAYGQSVNLVDYSWFQNWKMYLRYEFNIVIEYRYPVNASKMGKNVQESLIITEYPPKKSVSMMGDNQFKKPAAIRNHDLFGEGEDYQEIKPNLKKFVDYVVIPHNLWNDLVSVYGGGPKVQRKYPEIYTLKVLKVKVDVNGYFKPGAKTIIPNIQYSSQLNALYKQSELKNKKLFYKYPGQQNWIQIKNIQMAKFTDFPATSSIYLAQVPDSACDAFIDHYNIITKNNKSYIDNRIKNYASMINVAVEGVIVKGLVVSIYLAHIRVLYKIPHTNDKKLVKMTQQELNQYNSSDLTKDRKLNYMAGMNNFANNCYMNSVFQCLIRTPFLEQMLTSFEKSKPENADVTFALLNVMRNSKNLEVMDMQVIKKTIEKHLPQFQGRGYQDAQQFLIGLLQYIQSEQNKQKFNIVQKFTGSSFSQTNCSQCKTKNIVQSSFYTYSLSMPQINEYETMYYYISLQKPLLIQACMVTSKTAVHAQQFREIVCDIHNKRIHTLVFMLVKNKRIVANLTNHKSKDMENYRKLGYTIIVFEKNPDFLFFIEIYFRSQATNKFIGYPLLMPANATVCIDDIEKFIKEKINCSQQLQLIQQLNLYDKRTNKCLICHKKIPKRNSFRLGFNNCKGCMRSMNKTSQFFDQVEFQQKIPHSMIIVDWNQEEDPLNMKVENHQSIQKARLQRSAKVEDLLQKNMQHEEKVSLRCSNKKCHSEEAIRKQGISKYPNIFIIHLNRFRYNNQGMSKINSYVQYSEILKTGGHAFQLYGTVIHQGSINKGHYKSYVLLDKNWYLCNDERVTRVEDRSYLNTGAYILFYKRKS